MQRDQHPPDPERPGHRLQGAEQPGLRRLAQDGHLAPRLDPDRLGVCIDTCHAFAAGYAMETEKEFKATVRQLNQTVGLAKVKALHLNDSKKPLGSRVDRHEHIGRGEMGLAPFRHLMNDRRFARKPMYLETPKGEEKGKDLDAINLATLRRLTA